MTVQPHLANTARPPLEKLLPNPKGKQFHEVARFKHLSSRPERTYWEWVDHPQFGGWSAMLVQLR
jgi:hypothetical protein